VEVIVLPRLPSVFIRTSVAFLLLGFLIGGWMMVGEVYEWPIPPGLPIVHIHLLTVGFFTLMVFGVALWMFPAPPRSNARIELARRAPWAWACYGLMVAGLLLRVLLSLLPMGFEAGAGRPLVALSALMQIASALCFLVAIWDRTRPKTYEPTR
jgi:hypothetical protein